MFAPGVIGLPLTINQQALLQANIAAVKASSSVRNVSFEEAFQGSSALSTNNPNSLKRPLKRKYSDTVLEHETEQGKIDLAEALASVQPRTSKGKVYSWMQSGHPKRQRAKITEATKKEIIQFCKNHTLLKQGEIADIFGKTDFCDNNL